MTNLKTHIAALQWQLEAGVDCIVDDTPVDSTAMPELPKRENKAAPAAANSTTPAQATAPMASGEARNEAIRLAKDS